LEERLNLSRLPRWYLQLSTVLDDVIVAVDEICQVALDSHVVRTVVYDFLNPPCLEPLRCVGAVADLAGSGGRTSDVVQLGLAHALREHVWVESESDPDAAEHVVGLGKQLLV